MAKPVALIIALAERAARRLAPAHTVGDLAAQARLDVIVAGLLEQPQYAAAAVDLGTAAELVEAAVIAYYP